MRGSLIKKNTSSSSKTHLVALTAKNTDHLCKRLLAFTNLLRIARRLLCSTLRRSEFLLCSSKSVERACARRFEHCNRRRVRRRRFCGRRCTVRLRGTQLLRHLRCHGGLQLPLKSSRTSRSARLGTSLGFTERLCMRGLLRRELGVELRNAGSCRRAQLLLLNKLSFEIVQSIALLRLLPRKLTVHFGGTRLRGGEL